MQNLHRFRAPLGALALALGASAPAVTTVGTYAPNPNGLSIVNAASNSGANGLALGAFSTLVSSAFTSNLGGVIDFETASGWTTNVTVTSVAATYGVSQGNTLTLARTDAGGGFNSNNNNGTNVASGTSYLGMSLVNGVFTFDKGLSAFGLTMVPRGAARTSTLTFTLDDNSTISTSTESITASAATAVFFGVKAPTGRTIKGVSMAETGGFVRYDDLGFVVANPVPEPTSMAALGLGALALLRKRRK